MAASQTVEEAVRGLGKTHGPEGAGKALLALVVAALRGRQLSTIDAAHQAVVEALASGQASAADAAAHVEKCGKLADDHPHRLARRSNEEKVILYTLLACSAGPPAEPHQEAPMLGYAVSALEALLRCRQRGSRTSAQLDATRHQLIGEIAAMGASQPLGEFQADQAAEQLAAERAKVAARRRALEAERAELDALEAEVAARRAASPVEAPAPQAPSDEAPRGRRK